MLTISVCSIRVFDNFAGLRLSRQTYLNTFVIEVAQRCLDNGGSTVLTYSLFS